MKPSATLAPRLAWELCHQLTKLNLLLWDCYQEDFMKLAKEERVHRGPVSEEELELEIPF
jgi:hypothetical protein